TGAYVEAFYNPQTDTILNPMDQRCPSWTLFDEAKNHADFTNIAAALMPHDGGTAEPFWILSARTLFVESCTALVRAGTPTNQALASRLMMAELEEVHELVQRTVAEPLTAPEAARMAESVRAVLNTNAQALLFLPEHNPPFSICDWVRSGDKPGSILFITSSHSELTLNRALLSLWMNLAVHTLMRLPRTRSLRTWFFFDEVHALHRLPAIEDGMQTARGFGGAFVLGIHSFAKLSETYGKEGGQNLASLARTKLILGAADRDTAEHCSDFIGQREVRMMDEAYSYGYSNIRDAATITPRSEVQPLVLPDDIMKLPSLRGFLVYPEGFDAAHVKLAYKDYPEVAPAYVLRENVEPLEYRTPVQDSEPGEDDDNEQEAGGRALKPDPEIEADREEEPRQKSRRARGNAADRREILPGRQGPDQTLRPGSLASGMAFRAPDSEVRPDTQARETGGAPKPAKSAPGKGANARAGKAARDLSDGLAADARGRSPDPKAPPQQAGPELDFDLEP
ncbi:MAG: type IV secretion system DNA-binding domain-containing protein, partial [Sphingobium sp.]